MRENVLLRYGLSFLIALPIGFLLLYPHILRCAWVSHSDDFTLLAGVQPDAANSSGSVYVNQSATPRQQAELRRHVSAARDRIRRFWGGHREGRATLIYCPDQADYERYCAGGEGAGCSLGTPWGASYLVLGPEGNNTDVIAHELCHDELFARLGWWTVKRQIPQWFNEGLALMVDYRFTNPDTWERPDSLPTAFDDDYADIPSRYGPMIKLSELESTRDFFGGGYQHVMLAYQTAAAEVSRWLAVVGLRGVPTLTQAVENGEPFYEEYRRLERVKRSR